MKKITFPLTMVICLMAASSGLCGEKINIKYEHAIYADAAGKGLRSPEGVTFTGHHLLVADSGNRRIIRYILQNGTPRADAVFSVPKMFPLMVQEDSKGALWVLDGKDRRISILNPQGGPAGDFSPKDMPDSRKIVPRSLKIDGSGHIHILDIFSMRVLVLEAGGKYLRQIPLPKGSGFFSDLAVDPQGNIYVLDSVRGAVYRAGKDGKQFLPLNLSLKENMNFPTSLDSDRRGNLFLIDQYGSGLAILDSDGSFIGRKLGMGWGEGLLYYPTQISIGPEGEVFVADTGNNRVQQFLMGE